MFCALSSSSSSNVSGAVVQVACGNDVVEFCNTWAGLRAGFILWGGYCILLSHLVMLQLLYQRGHTLGLLLGLQRLEERLDGDGDAENPAAVAEVVASEAK